ncbi:uncharacterized protein A1O5_12144 [Cladophialophora psammophila CBS 110553]|uniref:Uncharacterized protein n=1 Tax=Cladophialophora psammophila CBS 110553 TaxID=1182543 RepID=W9WM53_9EURO|nr:uncharacterized protein A1O5_12144 [Cladophialophora psammophila CBS 110553]EXJ59519.1 hypothetical protein A1O5_12144 [Cladophialophora psammophila CBS 110553]
MPTHLSVADGAVAKDGLAEGEAAQYEALKRSVLAEQERQRQAERERRVNLGLPPEMTREEKKEARREKKGRKKQKDKEKSKGGGRRRVLGMLCFGA